MNDTISSTLSLVAHIEKLEEEAREARAIRCQLDRELDAARSALEIAQRALALGMERLERHHQRVLFDA